MAKKKEVEQPFFLVSGAFWAHSLFRILIAALVFAGGWMLIAMARDQAVKLDDFQISTGCIDLASKPSWVKGVVETQIKTVPEGAGSVSLLDSSATTKIASTLAANPWVKEVKSVVRQFPNRVRAEVALRDPAAFVLRSGKFYVIASDGTRLPGEYSSITEPGLDLPMIVYVRSMPPAAGKIWDDPAVTEGAKVAAVLRKHPDVAKAARIMAIDTSNIGGRRTPRESEITLLTHDRTQIFWGRGVDYPGGTELSPERKMAGLKAVLKEQGTIADKEYVDLRFPNPVFRSRAYYLGSL